VRGKGKYTLKISDHANFAKRKKDSRKRGKLRGS
jgi:hypothetical protein